MITDCSLRYTALSFASVLLMASANAVYATAECPGIWNKLTWTNCSGEMSWESGSRFSGMYVNGKRSGIGVFEWPNGDKYIGDFINNEITGKGIFFWMDGSKYIGELVDSNPDGQGTLIWTDGITYVGHFKKGNSQGFGTLNFSDGTVYSGNFINGTINGTGKFTDIEGQTYIVKFKDGNITEQYRDLAVTQTNNHLKLPDKEITPTKIGKNQTKRSEIVTGVAKLLIETKDQSKLRTNIEQTTRAFSLGAANNLLQQQSKKMVKDNWKYLDFSIGTEDGAATFDAKSVYGLKETPNWFLFNQSSLAHYNDRTTLNFGLGARHINDAETVITGLNAFYDYEAESEHQRASIGGEVLTSMGQIRANQYRAISGDIIYDDGTETALDGTDVKLTYELPYFYGSDIYYKYTHWYDSSFDDYRNEVGVTVEIAPYLTFKVAGYDSSYNGEETIASISYSIPLGGMPKSQKVKLDGKFSTGLKPIRDMLYIPVERENRIMKTSVNLGVVVVGY